MKGVLRELCFVEYNGALTAVHGTAVIKLEPVKSVYMTPPASGSKTKLYKVKFDMTEVASERKWSCHVMSCRRFRIHNTRSCETIRLRSSNRQALSDNCYEG